MVSSEIIEASLNELRRKNTHRGTHRDRKLEVEGKGRVGRRGHGKVAGRKEKGENDVTTLIKMKTIKKIKLWFILFLHQLFPTLLFLVWGCHNVWFYVCTLIDPSHEGPPRPDPITDVMMYIKMGAGMSVL